MAQKLVRGGHVITDASRLGNGGLIEDGAVAIDGSRVVETGPYAELADRYPDADAIGSERHVVLPGLINTHHHGWGLSSLQLGFTDDYLEPWILDIWQMKPIDAYLDTLWADLRNIRSGVTTLLHAAYGRDWGNYEGETRAKLQAHADSGIRAGYALHTLNQNSFVYQDDAQFLASLPGELADRTGRTLAEIAPAGPDDFFSLLDALHDEYQSHSRIRIMICPVGPQWCSDDLLRGIRARANEYEMPIHLHCVETPYQREYGLQTYGQTPVAHLNELGFLGPGVSLGHAVWLTDGDIDICSDTGTSVCHNASSNLRLRSGILPASRLLEKGVNVSIGMDGMTLNDDEDMLGELRVVAALHRLPRGLEHVFCPSSGDVLKMATVNGARSMAMESEIGKLEVGSKADLALVDYEGIAKPHLDPRVSVIDAVLYRARAADVDTVIVDGEVLLAGGEFVNIDEAKVVDSLSTAAEVPLAPLTQRWFDILGEIRPYVAAFYERWETPAWEPCYRPNSLA